MTEPSWVRPTHQALNAADVTIVGYVPDSGLSHLITRLDADATVMTVRLTTEEEGIGLATGAWLGGRRSAVLMQSSGVGNCTNMFSLLAACQVPTFVLVTMRGQNDETNPWQVPMGRAAGVSMELMGLDVRSAAYEDVVAATVSRALTDTFASTGRASAVLIDQQVIGTKRFVGDVDDAQ